MARICLSFAVLLVAGFLAVARADGEVPTLHACEISAASIESEDFIARSLGGSADCVNAEEKGACCDQIRALFGEGGAAEFCMCNEDFFSSMMMGLPSPNGVDPSDYVDMLKECGVPVTGQVTCPGTEEEKEVEPKVQSQIITSLILARVLGGGGRGGGGSPAPKPKPSPAPAPPPTPPPAPVMPAAGGKKGGTKVVTVAPSAGKKGGGGGTMVTAPAATPVAPAPTPVAPAPAPAAPASGGGGGRGGRGGGAPGAPGGSGGGAGNPGAPGGGLLGGILGGSAGRR